MSQTSPGVKIPWSVMNRVINSGGVMSTSGLVEFGVDEVYEKVGPVRSYMRGCRGSERCLRAFRLCLIHSYPHLT